MDRLYQQFLHQKRCLDGRWNICLVFQLNLFFYTSASTCLLYDHWLGNGHKTCPCLSNTSSTTPMSTKQVDHNLFHLLSLRDIDQRRRGQRPLQYHQLFLPQQGSKRVQIKQNWGGHFRTDEQLILCRCMLRDQPCQEGTTFRSSFCLCQFQCPWEMANKGCVPPTWLLQSYNIP